MVIKNSDVYMESQHLFLKEEVSNEHLRFWRGGEEGDGQIDPSALNLDGGVIGLSDSKIKFDLQTELNAETA